MSYQIIRNVFKNSYVSARYLHNLGSKNFGTSTSAAQINETVSNNLQNTSANNDEPIDIENPFKRDKQQCILCRLNIHPNYKNVRLLSQFQSPYTGKIYGRHITGLCKQKQEIVEKEILKSQDSGHMPTYLKLVEFVNDPKLFDPERPIRPHKY